MKSSSCSSVSCSSLVREANGITSFSTAMLARVSCLIFLTQLLCCKSEGGEEGGREGGRGGGREGREEGGREGRRGGRRER